MLLVSQEAFPFPGGGTYMGAGLVLGWEGLYIICVDGWWMQGGSCALLMFTKLPDLSRPDSFKPQQLTLKIQGWRGLS